MSTRATLVAATLLLLAGPAGAQIFRYMAFGDSITEGRDDFDEQHLGGYPGRLPGLLGCALPSCEVVNKGQGGEQTSNGVTRIENILDNQGPWDVVLLMEGSNDVHNNVSNNTIFVNLALMDTKARTRGVDTLHGSIIHLDPDSDSGGIPAKVQQVESLRSLVMTLASNRNRYFADPWTRLCPDQQCFNQHYHNPGPGDPNTVGHPDASGFQIMADEFRDSIVEFPLPGLPIAVSPSGTVDQSSPDFLWNKESGGWANWYQVRLFVGTTMIRDDWYEEDNVCSGSQCGVNLGTFPDGDYTWEVRGRNPRGRSAWVSTPFTILTVLPPTELQVVAPSGPTADPEPDFEWFREDPVAANRYRLEVSDTGGVIYDQLVNAFGNCDADRCTFDAFGGNPVPEGDYTWRVRGENQAGEGPWTPMRAFSVDFAVIFADGFESGDTTAWSNAVP